MAETVTTNQFRNGMHIQLDGDVWRIVDFQHVKPGKGGAFVRTKLKSIGAGSVVDRTFRAGEKFPRVHTEVKNVQYLYDAGDEVVFMDEETFEQFGLPRASVAEELEFLQPSSSVHMLAVDGKPGGVQMPIDDGFPRMLTSDLLRLKRLAEDGELRPVIDRRYALDEIVEAPTITVSAERPRRTGAQLS